MFEDITGLKLARVRVFSAILILLLLSGLVFAQTSKIEAYSQTANQLLKIGGEQYQRGLYKDAQLSLLKAAQYKEYLGAGDVKKLNILLGKVILKASGKAEADSQDRGVWNKETDEPTIVELGVGQEFEQVDVNENGLVIVAPNETPMSIPLTTPATQTDDFSVNQPIPAQAGDEKSYIYVVNQKRRIQQSFTKAVVNDAITKAEEFSKQNEFAKAKDEIARAANVVNNNKLLLGDAAYSDYVNKLDELREEIVGKETIEVQNKAGQRRLEAEQSQKRIIEQQATDRERRIADLMNNALEYQDQQRYTEALGQLETLLAIDPTNHSAAIMKRMLEDTINLRRQLEIKRQSEQQEIDLFNETRQSTIPHAEDITFPSNWPELTKKRERETAGALDPLDVAVYRQLESVVDLSALQPDMSLEEAIEEIRNSVEPPLKLIIRWRDLSDNAYIERDTTIGTQGLSDIPLGKGLSELLKSISGGIAEIEYAVDQGIITIATSEALPGKMITDIYDVTELISNKAQYSVDLDIDTEGGSSDIGQTSDQSTETGTVDNVTSIIETIQRTIEPDSWYVNGGKGSIFAHGATLIIRQNPEIHEKIRKLLADLRESLGQQVAIEARFLFVSENFLEDIGIDADIRLAPIGKFSTMILNQSSYEFAAPGSTKVPGSLAPSVSNNPGLSVAGIQYGSVLDDLSVSLMLRATQAHVDSKTLTAPKVTVLSGERAFIRISKGTAYISDYDFQDITSSGDNQPTRVIADPTIDTTTGGVVLNVIPTISIDKRYVLLDISTSYADNDLKDFSVFSETTGASYPIQLPVVETAVVQTRVSVPDGGTLLIGGQKLSAEINKEAGVPGMSKMPLIGRLFSNRSKVKDQQVLLILVKPTIILQDEAEREAFAPLE